MCTAPSTCFRHRDTSRRLRQSTAGARTCRRAPTLSGRRLLARNQIAVPCRRRLAGVARHIMWAGAAKSTRCGNNCVTDWLARATIHCRRRWSFARAARRTARRRARASRACARIRNGKAMTRRGAMRPLGALCALLLLAGCDRFTSPEARRGGCRHGGRQLRRRRRRPEKRAQRNPVSTRRTCCSRRRRCGWVTRAARSRNSAGSRAR